MRAYQIIRGPHYHYLPITQGPHYDADATMAVPEFY